MYRLILTYPSPVSPPRRPSTASNPPESATGPHNLTFSLICYVTNNKGKCNNRNICSFQSEDLICGLNTLLTWLSDDVVCTCIQCVIAWMLIASLYIFREIIARTCMCNYATRMALFVFITYYSTQGVSRGLAVHLHCFGHSCHDPHKSVILYILLSVSANTHVIY